MTLQRNDCGREIREAAIPQNWLVMVFPSDFDADFVACEYF